MQKQMLDAITGLIFHFISEKKEISPDITLGQLTCQDKSGVIHKHVFSYNGMTVIYAQDMTVMTPKTWFQKSSTLLPFVSP